ncbi:hypothetical protein [Streptomyces sp. NPDC003943]
MSDDARPGRPWRAVVIRDLRYDARGLTVAAREGRRPVPRAVRRVVEVYSFPRHQQDPSVARWAAAEERRARQRLRARLGAVVRLVNSVGGLAVEAADVVDVPPARHRRGALWLA